MEGIAAAMNEMGEALEDVASTVDEMEKAVVSEIVRA